MSDESLPDGTAQIETVDASATGAPIAQELPTAMPHANGNGANGTNGYHEQIGSILPTARIDTVTVPIPTRAPFVPDGRLGIVDNRLPSTANMAPGTSMTTFENGGVVELSVPGGEPNIIQPARQDAQPIPAEPAVVIARVSQVRPHPLLNREPRPVPEPPARQVIPNPLTNRVPRQREEPVVVETQNNIRPDGLHGENFLTRNLPALQNINAIAEMTDALSVAYNKKPAQPSFPFVKDGKTYWYTFGKSLDAGVYELDIREAYYPRRDKDGTILDAHIVHNGPTLKIKYTVGEDGALKMDSLQYLDVARDAEGNAKSKSGIKEVPLDVARAQEITASMIPTREDLQQSWLEIQTAPNQKELRKLERKERKENEKLDKANRRIASLNQQLIDARTRATNQQNVVNGVARDRAQQEASIQRYRDAIAQRNGWAVGATAPATDNNVPAGAPETNPASLATATSPGPDTLPQDSVDTATEPIIATTDGDDSEQVAQAPDEQLTQEQLKERFEQIRRNAATIWAVDQDRSSPAGERFRTTYTNITSDESRVPTREDVSILENAYRDMLAEHNWKYGKFNKVIAGIDNAELPTDRDSQEKHLHTALSYAINQNYDLLFPAGQGDVESITGDPIIDLDIYRSRRLNRILNPRLLSLSQYNGQEMANFQRVNELVLQRLRRTITTADGRTVSYYDLSSLIEQK